MVNEVEKSPEKLRVKRIIINSSIKEKKERNE